MSAKQQVLLATLMLLVAFHAGDSVGQAVSTSVQPASIPVIQSTSAPQPLFDFNESDIKFKIETLMNVLRDSRHEGWVLAAYPDPKTSRPLIGAGFGLDVPATEHPQTDTLNPNPFLEPSTAQLWQAAGLDPEKLQSILDQYDRQLKAWKKKNFRRKIKTHALPPQLTVDQATSLLRISATQAAYNARAYCREFDQLTASQQMALSQLVFQMGVNLEEFVEFRSALNDDALYYEAVQTGTNAEQDVAHWNTVQTTLIQSQWARSYRSRAVAVIAMFDPDYANDPRAAERKVQAVLGPPPRRKKTHTKSARAESNPGHGGNPTRRDTSRQQAGQT